MGENIIDSIPLNNAGTEFVVASEIEHFKVVTSYIFSVPSKQVALERWTMIEKTLSILKKESDALFNRMKKGLTHDQYKTIDAQFIKKEGQLLELKARRNALEHLSEKDPFICEEGDAPHSYFMYKKYKPVTCWFGKRTKAYEYILSRDISIVYVDSYRFDTTPIFNIKFTVGGNELITDYNFNTNYDAMHFLSRWGLI